MHSHLKQFKQPLYSTAAFEKFLAGHACFSGGVILDIGCGCGAVTSYMANRHKRTRFIGSDYNRYLISEAKKIPFNRSLKNLEFKAADLFSLKKYFKEDFSGIYSVHTLCCFKRIEPVIKNLANLRPNWIAFNSLFYEGPLDALIHIRDHSRPELKDNNPDGDFNIFSLELTKKTFAKNGFRKFFFRRFQIPVRLRMPEGGKRGTYTMRTELGRHTQFSGPVHLPWYFVLAKKG